LTHEWRKLELTFRTEDARVRRGGFAIHLYGKTSVATLDDASFTFNPEENPQVSIESEKPVTRTLRVQVKTRNASALLHVAGKPVDLVDGAGVAEIAEGLACVAVQAEAKGENPGVAVKIVGHPETDGRWRVAAQEQPDWTKADFDDARWQQVAPAPDGMAWTNGDGAKTVLLRQVLLWNQTHYGPNRCIVPPVREWGFPRGGMETIHLALYSPLPYRLDNYEFTLDVPVEFTILRKTDYPRRYVMNNPAAELTAEPLVRDGMKYTRFRMHHPGGEVVPDKTQYSLIPVKMSGDFKPDSCRFHFRRSARGNFTELAQAIPVKILPPVNGRQPRDIMISQYSPLGYSTLSKEHLEEHARQDAAAGVNLYSLSFVPGWGELWRNYVKLFHDTVTAAGSRVSLWMNFPLNYGGAGGGHLEWYPAWIKEHAEAHGVYYKNAPKWGETPYKSIYCNEYVISEQSGDFWEIVKKEYARALQFYPKANLIWSDWEFHNVTKDGSGVHCFCKRCKDAFRRFAELPDSADLSDETIMKNHRAKWLAFRDRQDGEIQGRMAQVAHALDRKYMTYSWASNETFWAACKGKLDVAFPGMPGNTVADSYLQPMLDDFAKAFRERTGLQRAMGQRFVFFKHEREDGWKTTVLSHDGFVHPESWKAQVLRVVATLRGGIDIQNSIELVAGTRYYVGEATRIIGQFEHLFWDGERADDLAASDGIGYPNLLVLKLGPERLVLLFNETDRETTVTLRNKNLAAGQNAVLFRAARRADNPAAMTLAIPAQDVVAVHIK